MRAAVVALCVLVLLPCALALWATDYHSNERIPSADPCPSMKDCQSCIATKICGWCSSPVVGGPGTQCAGTTNGTAPFICYGTFQTTTCITTTSGSSGTGQPTTSTGPTTSSTTTSTTGPNPEPPVRGFWRGLQINTGYVSGEWTFNFTGDFVEVRQPNGAVAFGGNVYSSTTEMDIYITEGNNRGSTLLGIYEEDYGPASLFLTYAISPVGTKTPPASWGVAMNDKASTVWALEQPKAFKK